MVEVQMGWGLQRSVCIERRVTRCPIRKCQVSGSFCWWKCRYPLRGALRGGRLGCKTLGDGASSAGKLGCKTLGGGASSGGGLGCKTLGDGASPGGKVGRNLSLLLGCPARWPCRFSVAIVGDNMVCNNPRVVAH
jgi:hypothetical protein